MDMAMMLSEARDSLVSSREHFQRMRKETGFAEPVVRALLYGAAAGLIEFLFLRLGLARLSGIFDLWKAPDIMTVAGPAIGAVPTLFIAGIITMLMATLCGGSSDYRASVQATSYLFIMLPLRAVVSALDGAGFTLQWAAALCVNLYGFYMLYHALAGGLGCRPRSARFVSAAFACIVVAGMSVSMMCHRAAGINEFKNPPFPQNAPTVPGDTKMIEKWNKAVREAGKEQI